MTLTFVLYYSQGLRGLFSGLVSSSEADRAAKEHALEQQISELTPLCEAKARAHEYVYIKGLKLKLFLSLYMTIDVSM